MTPFAPPRFLRLRHAASTPAVFVAAGLMLAVSASQAQYKVIGADGKITYTDRAPPAAEGKASVLGAKAQAAAAEPDLPFELRQATSKYPVTLYTVAGACEPCASARQLLKQRGIPFNERQVVTNEDSDALEKLSGAREAPTVTIGSQTLRGLATEVWVSYLDAAGYPRDSRLPSSYQYRPATPIVDRREPAVSTTGAAGLPTGSDQPAPPQAPPTDRPGGIRF
jgi:glutaredoxin